ncbi:MAG: hypothetical protein JO189_19520 [Deltaproteobacteria bacterium]|nr:hypothetical protein [Deltaproteobacteria bacterium]
MSRQFDRRRQAPDKNQHESEVAFCSIRLKWLSSSFAAPLLFTFADAALAKLPNSSTINNLAREAYCSEAKLEFSELENGSVSYKQVVEHASNQSLIEHPNVYPDLYAWKVKIAALLDQEGDDPGQLCNRKSFELID